MTISFFFLYIIFVLYICCLLRACIVLNACFVEPQFTCNTTSTRNCALNVKTLPESAFNIKGMTLNYASNQTLSLCHQTTNVGMAELESDLKKEEKAEEELPRELLAPYFTLKNILIDANAYTPSQDKAVNEAINNDYPSAIVGDWLYLGGFKYARNEAIIKTLGITHILNVSKTIPNYFEKSKKYKITYGRVPCDDVSVDSIYNWFDAAKHFINQCNPCYYPNTQTNENKKKILVHCAVGMFSVIFVFLFFYFYFLKF